MALVIVADDSKCPPNDQGGKCISFGCEVDPRAPITLGEWHLNLPKAKTLADEKNIPLIAIWSNTGCSHCQSLLNSLLTQKFIDWRTGKSWKNGTYSCPPMILVFMEGGKEGNEWIDENGKLHNQENGDDYNFVWGPDKKTTLYPFVAFYWKQKGTSKPKTLFTHGEDLTDTYGGDRGASNFISRAEVFFDGYQGLDLENNRLLDNVKKINFGNSNNKLVVNKPIALTDFLNPTSNNFKQDIYTDLFFSPVPCTGWMPYSAIKVPIQGSYASEWKFIDAEIGDDSILDKLLKLTENSFRPITIIYGEINDLASHLLIYALNNSGRDNSFYVITSTRTFDDDANAHVNAYLGYYNLCFLQDPTKPNPKLEKVKQFINQFEDISSQPLPWYMVYCKKSDGSVYARYGSIKSISSNEALKWVENGYKSISAEDKDIEEQLYTNVFQFHIGNLISFGHDINYVKQRKIRGQIDGGDILEYPELTSIVKYKKDGSSVLTSLYLPNKEDLESKIKDPAYAVSAFIDEATNKVYYPGQKIEVDDDITLKVVFDKPLIYTVSFAAKSSDETILLQSIVAKSENGSTTVSCVLPESNEVTSKCSKPGFIASAFEDQSSKTRYGFGQTISISRDITLCIVWREQHGEDVQKPIKVQTKHVLSFKKNQFPISYTYTSLGYKFLRISNNISSINFHGMIENRGLESQVTSAYIPLGISHIDASCFYNCYNLTAINSNNSIKMIGDYAFYGCKSLTNAEFLGTGNKVLTHIGDYAFAGSGLKDLVINLQGSVSDSSTNTHCFANCTELTSVNMTNSTYLADHMFDGCTKLQKVNLNNYHSYINEYAFANCTMLTSITLPAKTYMLPDHMFDGCTNLMQVKLQEPSYLRQLGEGVFAGCSRLTSITLPASISSLEYIDPLFLSGSSIDRVVFNGISDGVFADTIQEPKEYALPPSVLYEDAGKIKTILADVLTSNIPVIAIRSNDNGCGICNSYKNAIYGTPKFKKWLTTENKYYWVLGYHDSNNAGYNTITNFLDKHCGRWGTHYLQVGFYWKKDDGTEVTAFFEGPQAYSGKYSTIDKYIDQLENHVFKGYEGEGEIIYVTKDEITTFGRGQDLSVTFVSSTGREWICANDSVVYAPETRVDHYTTSDFKYGIWYYNIRELKAFADANNLPLLLEFGSRGCDPCVDFKKNTFNDQEFQTEIASKPCLLCKVEIGNGEAFDRPTTTQAYYASHEFGDPKTLIPQLVYYWKKASGEIYKKIWNYNYRSDPGNANYQTVLAKLDEMLGGYTGDSRFVAPRIQSMNNNKYRFYVRDSEDDLEGRYFVCDRKTSELSFADCTLSVSGFPLDGESGMKPIETVVLTSISLDDTVNVPDGAYQYFTVGEGSRYHDLSGIIFTIADRMVIGLCKFENEVGATYSPDDGVDTGYWIHFDDNSIAESIATQIQKYESTSTPMVVFERPSTVGATATFVPKSGSGSAQTQTFQIDIDSAKSQDDISALVRSAIGSNNTLQAISNMEELANLQRFNSQIRYGFGFTSWAKKRKYGLVDVASNSWSVGAPSKFREFESSTGFDDNTPSDPLPKFLVYHGCSTCTTDGSVVIYCKKKIEVDFTKNLNYYTSLIDEYASLTEEA